MAKISRAQQKKALEDHIKRVNNKIETYKDDGDTEKLKHANLELEHLEQQLKDLSTSSNKNKIDTLLKVLSADAGHWAYITSRQQFINLDDRSVNPKISNVQELVFSPTAATQSLCRRAGIGQGELDNNDIITLFDKTNRSYDGITASFDVAKWSNQVYFNIMTARQHYFCEITEPVGDEPIRYHEAFDILMRSLGAGKQDNTEFLEKYLAYKRLFPERHVSTPDLILIGLNGGEGKGLYREVAFSCFTTSSISIITNKQLNGGFNSLMRGAVFGILDDQSKKDFNQEALLALGGNDTMVVEQKGVDAVNEDKCGNMIIMSNKPNIVNLAGTGISGVDRRWSYLVTNTTFMNATKEYFLERDGIEMTDLEAKEYANRVSIDVFKNRIECGLWISAMIVKHNIRDMKTLLPCHGEDYIRQVNNQKDAYITIFERIVPEMLAKYKFVSLTMLRAIISVETDIEIKKQSTRFVSKFETWLEKKNIHLDKKDRVRVNWIWPNKLGLDIEVGHTQGTVYTQGNLSSYDYDLSDVFKTQPSTFNGVIPEADYADEDHIVKDTIELQTQYVPTGQKDEYGTEQFEPEIVPINTAQEEVKQPTEDTILKQMLKNMKGNK